MSRKITMVDLAAMCEVSVATVSYVLNDKQGARVSEATRQKILQMANLYMYRSNPYAKSLATGEMHNVLFFYNEDNFALARAEILDVINQLCVILRPHKYNIITAPSNLIAKYNYVDAIITYRIDKDTFKKLGDLNFIPLISIDCIIQDNLFFEINNSFNNINDKEATYLALPYKDETTTNLLKSKGDVIFINNFNELHNVLTTPLKHIVCLSLEIHNYLQSLNIKHEYIELNNQDKFDAVLKALKLAIDREEVDVHQYLID